MHIETMSPERFRQIRNLFEAVMEQQPGQRESFLEEACRDDQELQHEVQRLLDVQDKPLPWLDRAADARTDPRRMEGRVLGPYQVLREIGHGGMGTVYLATRADHVFRKSVAIKILQMGVSPEIVARFEQEREILASLDHPNIARLLDGGTTPDGLSYLVMEYVQGRPIDRYCDEEKLDIAARLQLFRSVCTAVDHAHKKHIIHRDLKPANILVTAEGTVKLLDFGIAKLMPENEIETTALITRTGLRLMTAEYASPEQIRGEIVGTGTDIYALGVVLYELLTGQFPYRLRSRVFHEIVRVISEEPPVRPSTAVSNSGDSAGVSVDTAQISRVRRVSPADLRRRLAGDLDGILLKTLEKDARDRYRSATGLSSDIDRYLEGLPVTARQAGPGYRAGKFIRRRLPWILIVAALVAVFTSGGITIHRNGALAIGGCLTALGLWYLATNREVGRRIAESEFFYTYLPPRAFLVTIAGLVVQKPFAIFFAILSPIIFRQVAGWFGRRRSAGNFILDLSELAPFLSLLCFANIVVGVIELWRQPSAWYYPLGYVSAGMVAFLHGKLEIRVGGIMYAGSLYAWENIERYEWEMEFKEKQYGLISLGLTKSTQVPKETIRLHLRRSIQFLPPVRIPMPNGRREDMEALLKRYLSEWPSGAPNSAAN
jgi:serine/threonine protein kinase